MKLPQLLDINHGAYHLDQLPGIEVPTLSRSIADILVNQTPRHAAAAHPKLPGRGSKKATKAMDAGTLLHLQLLGGGPPIEIIGGFDNWMKKEAKARRAQAHARGYVALLEHEHEPLERLKKSILESLDEQFDDWTKFTNGCTSEATLIWESDGVICRARHDNVRPGQSFDLKFTRDASDDAVARTIRGGSHGLQTVSYIEGMDALWPELAGRNRLTFIFIEATLDSSKWKNDSSTHCCRAVEIDAPARSIAEAAWKRAKRIWKECLASGVWPSYPKETLTIGPAAWQLREALDREIMAGGFADPVWMDNGENWDE